MMEEKKTWYLCDPELNKECRKSSCGWMHRGGCYMTSQRIYARTIADVADEVPMAMDYREYQAAEFEAVDRTIHELDRIREIGIVNAREDLEIIHDAVGWLELLKHYMTRK